jgi:hypothetical protein
MGTGKIVDFTEVQSNPCRVFVNGERAFFDPTDSDATIKAAIEALSTMSGHTVTVTNLISQRKWQFDFSNTLSTFFAAKSSDLGFANPSSLNLTLGGSTSISSTTGLTDLSNGLTVFFRFKMGIQGLNLFWSMGGPSNNILYAGFYSSFGIYFGSAANGGATNNSYATTGIDPGGIWATATIRIPPPVSPATETAIGDCVVYINGVLQSLSIGLSGSVLATGTKTYFGSSSFASYPSLSIMDQLIVIDHDIGDTDAKLINDMSSPITGTAIMLKCDEGSGTTAFDSSGNGNDFTVGDHWSSDTTTTVISDVSPSVSGNASLMIRRHRLARSL